VGFVTSMVTLKNVPVLDSAIDVTLSNNKRTRSGLRVFGGKTTNSVPKVDFVTLSTYLLPSLVCIIDPSRIIPSQEGFSNPQPTEHPFVSRLYIFKFIYLMLPIGNLPPLLPLILIRTLVRMRQNPLWVVH
jgi:hypothetical protein